MGPIAYIPPPRRPEPLPDRLTRAVRQGDITAVRTVLDEAFWENKPLKPDWYHLLCAMEKNDVALARLLVTHGAKWKKDQACVIAAMLPQQWPDFTKTLKKAGIDADFGNLAPPKRRLHAAMTARIAAESGNDGKMDEKLLSQAILACLAGGDEQEAEKLMRQRQPQGALNASKEVALMMESGFSPQKNRKIIDTLSLIVEGRSLFLGLNSGKAPEVAAHLEWHGLLHPEQPLRVQFLRGWVDATKENEGDFKYAAFGLFSKEKPLTKDEVGTFLAICALAAADGKDIAPLCDGLRHTGFFTSKEWTHEELGSLADMIGQPVLKKEFNRAAAKDRFERAQGWKKAVAQFDEIVEAHRQGYYQASRSLTETLLHGLVEEYKSGKIPPEVKEGLRVMKEAGAVFDTPILSALYDEYLGKKEPGLVKVMLDLDIISLRNHSLKVLRKKAGLNENGELNPKKHKDPYVEFYCQVMMERAEPSVYIPLRGRQVPYIDDYLIKYPDKRRKTMSAQAPKNQGLFVPDPW